MGGYPDDQGNPAGAIPVYMAGSNFENVSTSTYIQIKTGAGVFSGLSINTAGTTSAAAFYDGYSAVVTITIATPGVVSWAAHGLVAGNAVKFTNTGGALPTGLTSGTTVYVSTAGFGPNSFQVADTQAHALAGTNSIATSGSQSGVQTAWDVTDLIGTFATTAVDGVQVGAQLVNGLIVITTDSGGAANITVLYR